MNCNDHIDAAAEACCCGRVFSPPKADPLLKDPWECYEGDADACAPEAADEAEDCGCCCC